MLKCNHNQKFQDSLQPQQRQRKQEYLHQYGLEEVSHLTNNRSLCYYSDDLVLNSASYRFLMCLWVPSWKNPKQKK
ncbi:unnamed protein product [Schistosoma haematobium]|nr:unnamed protein product [Schistosoma haematobium]